MIELSPAVPILRIFDVQKALDFYVGFLGFKVDWEHRFEPNAPVYMQVSRGETKLHLSEHHGDGTPGTAILVYTTGLDALHGEVVARRYKYNRPGINEDAPGGGRSMTVTDPFGNDLRFWEKRER